MNSFWIGCCVFIAATTAAIFVMNSVFELTLGYRTAVRLRLRKLTGDQPDTEHEALFKKFALQDSDVQRFGGQWKQQLEEMRIQSGVRYGMAQLGIAALTLGIVAAGLSIPLLRTWYWTPLAFAVGCAAPPLYVRWKRLRRMRAVTAQLAKAFDLLGRSVKAGQSVQSAFQIVAQEFPPPISDEFRMCCEQQNLGVSYETALRQLGRRTGIMELQILAVALIVQARTGGSLSRILENLALMVRKRLRLKQRINALTGEGRTQALVLTILPFLAFFGLVFLAPEYIAALTARPWILGLTLVAQLVGVVWIRRTVSFDF
ncbi:MAG: type II secretion system F family protein [Pirellulales bacterium]